MCNKQNMFTTQEVPAGFGVFHAHNVQSVKCTQSPEAAAFLLIGSCVLKFSFHSIKLGNSVSKGAFFPCKYKCKM